ncbi:MAG: hypothetical protein KIT72_07175 [Polyangiaceae bacterium]|nr:hypothetical protein [Polyangiaceae bacterium]MCW5790185.1 hypothetical protein [Polyangiaceae bacterium]
MTAPELRPGLILELPNDARALAGRWFLTADVALRIVLAAEITRVPFSELGMALIEGQVLPVLFLSGSATELVWCELPSDAREAEPVLVSGARVLASGRFPAAGAGVSYLGEALAPLELGVLMDAAPDDE